jgi:hypothetical protein
VGRLFFDFEAVFDRDGNAPRRSELLESLVPKSDDTDDEAPMKLPPVPRAKKTTDDEDEKKKDRRRGRKAKKTILEEYGEEREKVLEKLGGSKQAPFPRDAVQEALVLDARDRAAAKKRALVEEVPPPPVFDPFEDNLVRAGVSFRFPVAAMASR